MLQKLSKICSRQCDNLWKVEDTGGETEIEKTRKGMEGRRYRGRDREREDKKGDGRQKAQGRETEIEKTRKGMEGRRYRGRDRDRDDKKGYGRQKIQGERLK
jgi:hypothetical protein